MAPQDVDLARKLAKVAEAEPDARVARHHPGMSDEAPRVRRRSEVGAGRRGRVLDQIPLQGVEVAAPVIPGSPRGIAPGFAGAGQGLDEDIGEFVRAVKAMGFPVSLVEAAQWGTELRDDVRRWLESERADLIKIPPCLAVKKTEGTAPRGTPAPGGIAALPVLADHGPHGPREPVPARASKKSKSERSDTFLETMRHALMARGLHPLLADMWDWSRLQVDVVEVWLEQNANDDDIPDWLERYRVNTAGAKKVVPPETERATGWEATPRGAPVSVVNRDPVPEKQDHGNALRDAEEREAQKGVEVLRDPDADDPPRPLPRAPEVSDQYAAFIETVLAEVDLEAEYTELEAALEIGEERRDYTTINAEVDKAQRRAQRANHLWGNVVVEHERLKLDQKEVDADLWKRALAKLEAEGSKTRIADVDAKIAEMFPDEWREGKLRVKKSEIAVERAKSFQERWSSRERALVAMLQAVRK